MGQSPDQRRTNTRQAILRHLARLGGQVFGPISKTGRREFFCLDEHTWVWHEEWVDNNGQRQAMTTRYDVHPQGILKYQGGSSYHRLTPREERNFRAAVEAYYERASRELQRLAHAA